MEFHLLQTQRNKLAILLIIIFASKPKLISSTTAPASQNFRIAKPNCKDRCGNISIPFPFGTTEGCYSSSFFGVTCNETLEAPKLFWKGTTIQIEDISLDGQMKVLQFIAKDCYYRNGTKMSGNSPWFNILTQLFTLNNTANKFTIVGCDTYGIISGKRFKGGEYATGCIAMCNRQEDLVQGSCTGIGCCQIPIPEDVWGLTIDLYTFNNYANVSDFNDCGYAFFAEETAFNFSRESLNTSFKNMNVQYPRLPTVLDWVIGSGTCEVAQLNSTDYACKSPNSECYNLDQKDGYRCGCKKGYQGNPYLDQGCQDIDECEVIPALCGEHGCVNTPGSFNCPCPKGYRGDGNKEGPGCQDIDECEVPALNNCTHGCENKPGSFNCLCPKGYRGDGNKGGPAGCSRESFTLKIVAGVSLGVVVLLLVACLTYLELKRRNSNQTKQKFFIQNGGMILLEKLNKTERSSDAAQIFSSAELEKATNDFHNNMIIGQGGFGTVYRGLLSDNRIVAIKKSKKVDPNQTVQFINEVIVLSQINHRNVVRLLGCCLDQEVPLLVYEFISNGTLASHIHNQAKARFLNWEMRLKIAAETAGVLSYLHSAASTPIIHRDVKSDNILLDHTFTSRVSDFGASKLVPLDHTQLCTMVQGTFGYLDPEYMQTNQLTEKSDVYSFGVVLLELLTGRRAISFDKPEEEKNLANFFLSMLKQERLFPILDENILDNGNQDQIIEVARLAQGCLNVRGEDRPSMKQVAMELEGLRFGGKHSWARTEQNVEEMEHLLGDGLNGNYANGDGNSSTVGYDSIRDHVLLPISGGR